MMQESLKSKKIKITMILIWFYHSKTNVATQSGRVIHVLQNRVLQVT